MSTSIDVGDRVEWVSHFSAYVFQGVVEGFYGTDRDVAFCTDHTGLRSRPVAVKRLRPASVTHWYTGRVA